MSFDLRFRTNDEKSKLLSCFCCAQVALKWTFVSSNSATVGPPHPMNHIKTAIIMHM